MYISLRTKMHMDENLPKFPKHSGPSTNYAYSGKVMLISVIVLFVFCIIFAGFHFYSRWFYIRRSRNLHQQRQRQRLFSLASSAAATSNPSATPKGLAPSVLQSLPTFLYSAAHGDRLECAVCMSEFEDNETGRILPKCNHAFHVECIDMWFLCHSNCPLCRAPIPLPHNPAHRSGNPPEMIISVAEPATSRLSPISYGNENRMGSSASSSSSLPQLLNVSVEIPAAREGVDIGPARENGLKTMGGPGPGPGPVRSLKRFLSS